MTKGLDKDIQFVYELVNNAVEDLEDVIDPAEHSLRSVKLNKALDRLFAALGTLRDLEELLEVDDEDLDFSGQTGRIQDEENDE